MKVSDLSHHPQNTHRSHTHKNTDTGNTDAFLQSFNRWFDFFGGENKSTCLIYSSCDKFNQLLLKLIGYFLNLILFDSCSKIINPSFVLVIALCFFYPVIEFITFTWSFLLYLKARNAHICTHFDILRSIVYCLCFLRKYNASISIKCSSFES